MKSKKNLYDKICDLDTIINMYDKCIRKNTKNKQKIEEFENNYSQNMIIIKELLASKKYVPGRYNIFIIKEPKVRIIMSQNIKDKIINHLVAKYILVKAFNDTLIYENCATRDNKGTHMALYLFKKYYNVMRNRHSIFYILKFDISKYFYSIDHNIVKNIIRNKIKDKDAISILERIIDSTNLKYVNEKIEKLKKKNIINNIPSYETNKGFPIGNMTSQIVACIYLNGLDHYIKEELHIKYYVRYMDDGIIIHHSKEYLKSVLKNINNYLNEYKLNLNNKTRIYKSNEEIEFLGFRFFFKNKIVMKVKNVTKKRYKRRMKKLYDLYKEGKVKESQFISVKNSYLGHLKHGSCGRLSLLAKNMNIDADRKIQLQEK